MLIIEDGIKLGSYDDIFNWELVFGQ
jgi:hypothetical protein